MGDDKGVSRRGFVKGGGVAALALGVGCESDAERPAEPAPIEPVVVDAEPVPEGMAAVGIVHRDDVEGALRRAIALAGGINEILPGDTVFIKPNAVHGSAGGQPGIVTDLDVLRAVVRIVKERRPGKVTVGDRSARPFATDVVFSQTGLRDAALEAGADDVFEAPRDSAEPDEWVLMQPNDYESTWGDDGGVLAMKRIIDADHLIDLATCKNHRWAAFSLSMKNLIGAIGDSSRNPMHYNEGDPDRLSQDIAILNQLFTPLISIIDARHALINGGPEGVLGDRVAVSPGLMLAGKDRVALDAAGAAILKMELSRTQVDQPDELHAFLTSTDVFDLPQIVHGGALGIGIARPEDILLRFDDVAEAAALAALLQA